MGGVTFWAHTKEGVVQQESLRSSHRSDEPLDTFPCAGVGADVVGDPGDHLGVLNRLVDAVAAARFAAEAAKEAISSCISSTVIGLGTSPTVRSGTLEGATAAGRSQRSGFDSPCGSTDRVSSRRCRARRRQSYWEQRRVPHPRAPSPDSSMHRAHSACGRPWHTESGAERWRSQPQSTHGLPLDHRARNGGCEEAIIHFAKCQKKSFVFWARG